MGALERVEVHEADHVVLEPRPGVEPQGRAHRGADAGGEDAGLGLEASVLEDVREQERDPVLHDPPADGAAHLGQGLSPGALRGLDPGLGRIPFQQQDGPPLRGHRLEEQVQDLVEELVQRPMHHELAGRLAQGGQHPVLALQLGGVDRGLGVDVGQLADGEDAGSFRLELLLHALVAAEGEGVLAQGDDVALPQAPLVLHGQAVQERPVLALKVGHVVAVRALDDLGVVAGEPLVGEEDVALPRTADAHPVLGDRVALPGAVGGLDADLGHAGSGGILQRRPGSVG